MYLFQINMNTDVRLVGVNEHMVRHKLLVGVADWVQKCRGKLQVIAFVLNIMHVYYKFYLMLPACLVSMITFPLGEKSIEVLWQKVTGIDHQR